DLLLLEDADWGVLGLPLLARLDALVLHRRMKVELGHDFALTAKLQAFIFERFPWSSQYAHLPELRDLRRFVIEELSKARIVADPDAKDVSLDPTDAVGRCVDDDDFLQEWRKLIWATQRPEQPIAPTHVGTWGLPDETLPDSISA